MNDNKAINSYKIRMKSILDVIEKQDKITLDEIVPKVSLSVLPAEVPIFLSALISTRSIKKEQENNIDYYSRLPKTKQHLKELSYE